MQDVAKLDVQYVGALEARSDILEDKCLASAGQVLDAHSFAVFTFLIDYSGSMEVWEPVSSKSG